MNMNLYLLIQNNNKPIYQYVYHKKKKTGILIAFKAIIDNTNKIAIGYSKCHSTKDIYNQNLGFNIAIKRAAKFINTEFYPYSIPQSFKKQMLKFIDRVRRYYKDCTLPEWVHDYEEYYKVSEEVRMRKDIKRIQSERDQKKLLEKINS